MGPELKLRCRKQCELCANTRELTEYLIDKDGDESLENQIVLCQKCSTELEDPGSMDVNHWRALNDSMWSEHRPVQIMAYRALSLLKGETWAQDLIDQMYIDDEAKAVAISGIPKADGDGGKKHLDSNGAQLSEGDNVTLIKDLVVKGANFTAKRGTMVRNISLTDDPKHIEGKVNGTRIVLVTKFLKRVNS